VNLNDDGEHHKEHKVGATLVADILESEHLIQPSHMQIPVPWIF
jgi:hypothetical protein